MNTDIKLILPNTKMGVVLDLKEGERLYFLAGPIRGGGDWQAKAISLLHEIDPFCYIVCPCCYNTDHELFRFQIKPTELPRSTDDERERPKYALPFQNQTMWERFYMEMAAQYGSVIFWLPCEDKVNPRKEGPYARDTYGELGRWSLKNANPDICFFRRNMDSSKVVNLTIGAEKDFPGLSVIQKNLNADHCGEFIIYPTLEEAISEAVRKGKKVNPQRMNFND